MDRFVLDIVSFNNIDECWLYVYIAWHASAWLRGISDTDNLQIKWLKKEQ